MSSRTAVAQFLAGTIMNGGNRSKATSEAAAWLVQHGKARQASYLAQDVALVLADEGYVFAQIATAKPVDDATKSRIENFLLQETNAKTVECEYITDEKLIGGVLISTPYGTLDASVRAALATIVEGVSQ